MAAVVGNARSDAATHYTFAYVAGALPEGARRLLEIGCGNGALAARLAGARFETVAIDSDPDAVAAARACGVDARLAQWPDFSDGLFDAVLFTRSLHHMGDLEASVGAAVACLAPSGRVIVEDFDAAFADEATFRWFASLLRLLRTAGAPIDSSEFLSAIAGAEQPREAWHATHGHHLHGAAEIERALRALCSDVSSASTAYFFRYVAAAGESFAALARDLLEHEEAVIRAGGISPLGRRFVAIP